MHFLALNVLAPLAGLSAAGRSLDADDVTLDGIILPEHVSVRDKTCPRAGSFETKMTVGGVTHAGDSGRY